jgi:hypothetical protein
VFYQSATIPRIRHILLRIAMFPADLIQSIIPFPSARRALLNSTVGYPVNVLSVGLPIANQIVHHELTQIAHSMSQVWRHFISVVIVAR